MLAYFECVRKLDTNPCKVGDPADRESIPSRGWPRRGDTDRRLSWSPDRNRSPPLTEINRNCLA